MVLERGNIVKILLDGNADLVFVDREKYVIEVIDTLESWVKKHGRQMVSVKYDGTLLTENTKNEMCSKDISDISTIEVETEPFENVTRYLFGTVYSYINELETGFKEVSILFSRGENIKGYKELAYYLNIWDWINDSLIKIRNMKIIDFDSLNIDNKSISMRLDETAGLLKKVIIALDNNDMVMLSDTLEYDFSAAITDQRKILKLLYSRTNGAEINAGDYESLYK